MTLGLGGAGFPSTPTFITFSISTSGSRKFASCSYSATRDGQVRRAIVLLARLLINLLEMLENPPTMLLDSNLRVRDSQRGRKHCVDLGEVGQEEAIKSTVL